MQRQHRCRWRHQQLRRGLATPAPSHTARQGTTQRWAGSPGRPPAPLAGAGGRRRRRCCRLQGYLNDVLGGGSHKGSEAASDGISSCRRRAWRHAVGAPARRVWALAPAAALPMLIEQACCEPNRCQPHASPIIVKALQARLAGALGPQRLRQREGGRQGRHVGPAHGAAGGGRKARGAAQAAAKPQTRSRGEGCRCANQSTQQRRKNKQPVKTQTNKQTNKAAHRQLHPGWDARLEGQQRPRLPPPLQPLPRRHLQGAVRQQGVRQGGSRKRGSRRCRRGGAIVPPQAPRLQAAHTTVLTKGASSSTTQQQRNNIPPAGCRRPAWTRCRSCTGWRSAWPTCTARPGAPRAAGLPGGEGKTVVRRKAAAAYAACWQAPPQPASASIPTRVGGVHERLPQLQECVRQHNGDVALHNTIRERSRGGGG